MTESNPFPIAIIALLLFATTNYFGQSITANKKEKFLAPPPEYIEHFHFGFRESMADSFWLRWIQDSDVCQVYEGKSTAVNEKSQINDGLTYAPRHKNCDNSWGFKMLDTVTNLAPKFIMAYWAGASSLSILVEDYAGASVIYEKGLKEYPDDWILLYRASYHYQFNVHDLAKAAELLSRASDRGGPAWLKSLASRLYTKSGQLEFGLSMLESYRKTIEPDKTDALKLVDDRIAELKRQLQP